MKKKAREKENQKEKAGRRAKNKKQILGNWIWLEKKEHAPYVKEQWSLKTDIIHQFPEHHIPFDVFSAVTNPDGLVKLLADESNLHAQQSSREFHTNEKEMSVFLEINYIKSITKPTIEGYWEYGH